jgi:hypothetical protein
LCKYSCLCACMCWLVRLYMYKVESVMIIWSVWMEFSKEKTYFVWLVHPCMTFCLIVHLFAQMDHPSKWTACIICLHLWNTVCGLIDNLHVN